MQTSRIETFIHEDVQRPGSLFMRYDPFVHDCTARQVAYYYNDVIKNSNDPQVHMYSRTQIDHMVQPLYAQSFLNHPNRISKFSIPRSSEGTLALFPCFKPEPNQTVRVNIAASSGSGKSTFVAKSVRGLQYEAGEDTPLKVYAMGTVKNDKSYVSLDATMWDVYDNFHEIMGLESPDFENCIVIFDDIPRKGEAAKKLKTLRSELMMTGRKKNVHVFHVCHRTLGGSETKEVLDDLTHMVWFPHSGQQEQIVNYLKKYYLPRDFIDGWSYLIQNPEFGRFVVYKPTCPRVIMNEKFIQLL